MTDHDITQIKYWVDLAVKAIIGIVVSIVGLDYRAVKNRLNDLHESKYIMTMEIQIIRAELGLIKDRLERIDDKLDRSLQK